VSRQEKMKTAAMKRPMPRKAAPGGLAIMRFGEPSLGADDGPEWRLLTFRDAE
jgi:hypothetical protein